MAKKSYNKEYIERTTSKYMEIIGSKVEYDCWTQICLTVQNAVKAAGTVWGFATDEQKANMGRFINELVVNGVLLNIDNFDITFKKRKQEQ
ncbi:hypothetical protein [Palleniella muris]|uniref:hypothetical protein n=1 Tax=Palleniella muris TaxID=3038145 RepID=UPI00240FDD62|nr:hypothetical protein [Palleniella muris]